MLKLEHKRASRREVAPGGDTGLARHIDYPAAWSQSSASRLRDES